MTEVIFVILFIGTMLFISAAISRADVSKREKERGEKEREEAFRMFVKEEQRKKWQEAFREKEREEALRKKSVKEEQQKAIKKLVQAHISTLYAKKRQTVKTDAYGNIFLDAWKKETAHFHNFVVVPKLHLQTPTNKKAPKHQIDSYLRQLEETRAMIEYAINSFATSRPARNFDVDKLTPTEFEAFCAQRLREDGWSVQTTKGSGDQGDRYYW